MDNPEKVIATLQQAKTKLTAAQRQAGTGLSKLGRIRNDLQGALGRAGQGNPAIAILANTVTSAQPPPGRTPGPPVGRNRGRQRGKRLAARGEKSLAIDTPIRCTLHTPPLSARRGPRCSRGLSECVDRRL
jgi:hypothetical protein